VTRIKKEQNRFFLLRVVLDVLDKIFLYRFAWSLARNQSSFLKG